MATTQSPSAFLPFFDEMVLKIANLQMLPEITVIKVTKLCELIALSLLIKKYDYYGGG